MISPRWRTLYRPSSDLLGGVLSGACAVHCLLAAVLAGALPVAASRALASEWVHDVLAVAVLGSSLLAFVPGWLRHGELRVWGWALSGLGLVICARWAGGAEPVADAVFTSAGGLLLMVAHRLNHSLAYWCDRW